jgi:sarcosine oxidase gamma subunit
LLEPARSTLSNLRSGVGLSERDNGPGGSLTDGPPVRDPARRRPRRLRYRRRPGAGPPVPTATLSPTTTLVSALPRQVGSDGGYQIFEVTPQQYQLIGQRVHEVIVRQKLYDQGVRSGAGVNQGKHHVLIDPGFSGLTAHQILNRLLGNP